MIEAVAEALFAKHGGVSALNMTWPDLDPEIKDAYRRMAATAISAMEECSK